MFEQSQDRLQRTSTNMSAEFCSTHNMIWATNRCRKYFSSVSLDSEYLCDLFDEKHSIPTTIINSSNEWRNVSGPGLCSEYGLSCRKNKGAIGANAIISKPLDCFHTVFDHG